MIEKILEAANRWKLAHPDIKVEHIKVEDDELIELTWKRDLGDTAYVDLFPEADGAVIAQHGTFRATDRREPCGVTRINPAEIEPNLERLRMALAAVQPLHWTYTPSVDIGVISSLKFH